METARNTHAAWCLRLVVAIQCLGLAAHWLDGGSSLHSLIFNWFDHDDRVGPLLDTVLAWTLVVVGLATAVRPWPPALFGLAALLLLDAGAATYNGGTFMSEWTLASRAARIAAPLALAWLMRNPKSEAPNRWIRSAVWAMRIGTAATFAAHGYKALKHSPDFIDLLLASAMNLLDWSMSQQTAEAMLLAIGAIDVIVAAMVLALPWRSVAGYMALWGIVAAFSRITAFGFEWWPQTLLRAANGGLPLALMLWWHASKRAHKAPDS